MFFQAFQNARRAGMELKGYNYSMANSALPGSKWECLMHFWDTNVSAFYQWIVFGKEANVNKLFKLEKKIPEMYLLGAIVEDRFMNKAQLQEYAKLPNIEQLRGELCSILQHPLKKTSSLLQSNQQSLSQNLEQYVKDQTKE